MPFRDIRERSFDFACAVIEFSELPEVRRCARRVVEQLVDAASSLGANLEEGAAGQSKRDFIAKTFIALKEARESRYWLRVIKRCWPRTADRATPLVEEAHEIVAIVTTILINAQKNPGRG